MEEVFLSIPFAFFLGQGSQGGGDLGEIPHVSPEEVAKDQESRECWSARVSFGWP